MDSDLIVTEFTQPIKLNIPRTTSRRFTNILPQKIKDKKLKIDKPSENVVIKQSQIDDDARKLTDCILESWLEARNKKPSTQCKRKRNKEWSKEAKKIRNNIIYI